MNLKYILLYIIIFIWTVSATGQNKPIQKGKKDRRDIIQTINPNAYGKFKSSYPITRDTLNKYADSTIITGKLVDYTIGVSCGIFCGCGTLKLKLAKQDKNYEHEYIYVGVPCLNVLPKEFKRKTIWTLYKLPFNDNSCFWTEVPMNKFDTKGLPFYTLKNFHFP